MTDSARRSARLLSPSLPSDVPLVFYLDAAEMGGAAVHAVDLAGGFRLRGYSVAVICHRSDEIAPLRAELAALGVDVLVAEDWDLSLLGRAQRVFALSAAIRRYRNCLLLLMTGNYRSGGPVTIAGVLAGARAIVRADLQPPMPPISWRHRVAINLKDLFVERVIVNALDSRDSFVQDMGRRREKIEVVHQGIDLAKFQPGGARASARSELGYPAESVVVGVISRLGGDVWRKGVEQFLAAAGVVAARAPRAKFLVVGDGGARSSLERKAEALGLAGRIDWLGWRVDVPRIFAAMDVFVMPSLYEGTPTILLEAMAMAKAVVASRVGAVPEVVIDAQNGLVVPPNDVGGLADAIYRLVAAPDLRARLGTCARETAVRSFSREAMIDGYLSVLGQVYALRSFGRRVARATPH